MTDYGTITRGIACDEYTAVCIDETGTAHVFGEYPEYEDTAYFIAPNCELADPAPEVCASNNALEWNHGGEALKVYEVKGTTNGSNTFDLTTWQTGEGGTWMHWHVVDGTFNESEGTAPACTVSASSLGNPNAFAYPNPASNSIRIAAARGLWAQRSACSTAAASRWWHPRTGLDTNWSWIVLSSRRDVPCPMGRRRRFQPIRGGALMPLAPRSPINLMMRLAAVSGVFALAIWWMALRRLPGSMASKRRSNSGSSADVLEVFRERHAVFARIRDHVDVEPIAHVGFDGLHLALLNTTNHVLPGGQQTAVPREGILMVHTQRL